MQTLQTLDVEILDSIDEYVIEEEVMHADEARERVELAIIQLNGVLGPSRPTSPTTHRVASQPIDDGRVKEEDMALEDTASGEMPRNSSESLARTIPATEDAHVAKGGATLNVKLPKLSLKMFGGDLAK